MSILNHRWGVSHEKDVVWSRVCGMDPDRADRALIMIWQGYFDESEKDDWFVIAGYLARVEDWAAFSAEWAPMARKYGRVDKQGRWHFHMTERSRRDDGREDLPRLRNIIADHVLMGLSVAMRPSAYRAAIDRLVVMRDGKVLKLKGNLVDKPYLFAFELFLDSLSDKVTKRMFKLDQINLESDRIEMIFDERAEKKIIRNAWDDFVRNHKALGIPNVLVSEPSFADDKEFLPLQAGDFFAYWLREKLAKSEDPSAVMQGVFPFTKEGDKGVLHNIVVMDEDELVKRWTSIHTTDGTKFIDRRGTVRSELPTR